MGGAAAPAAPAEEVQSAAQKEILEELNDDPIAKMVEHLSGKKAAPEAAAAAAAPTEEDWLLAHGQRKFESHDCEDAIKAFDAAFHTNSSPEASLLLRDAVLQVCQERSSLIQPQADRSMAPLHMEAVATTTFYIPGVHCDALMANDVASEQLCCVVRSKLSESVGTPADGIKVALHQEKDSIAAQVVIIPSTAPLFMKAINCNIGEVCKDISQELQQAVPPDMMVSSDPVTVSGATVCAQAPKFCKFQDRSSTFIEHVEESTCRFPVEELIAQKAHDEDHSSPQERQKMMAVPPTSSPQERKHHLLWLYTTDLLYQEMNNGLLTDTEALIKKYAGYIHELRDAFCISPEAILKPYQGRCCRGMNVADIDELYESLKIGDEFMFPSFTSTSSGNVVDEDFEGNVQLQFFAGLLPRDGQYAPASIEHCSKFRKEDEVLWPPHIKTRLHNMRRNPKRLILELETVELPSLWQLIQEGETELVKAWVEANVDRVETGGCKKSLINEIVKAGLAAGDETAAYSSMVESCIGKGANINEQDPCTGLTPVVAVVESIKNGGNISSSSNSSSSSSSGSKNNDHSSSSQRSLPLLMACLEADCDLSVKTVNGTAALDILPEKISEGIKATNTQDVGLARKVAQELKKTKAYAGVQERISSSAPKSEPPSDLAVPLEQLVQQRLQRRMDKGKDREAWNHEGSTSVREVQVVIDEDRKAQNHIAFAAPGGEPRPSLHTPELSNLLASGDVDLGPSGIDHARRKLEEDFKRVFKKRG